GRPRDGPERARQNRRDHWYPEDRQIWVQQAQGTFVAHAGDGRAPVYPLLQSQQTDAGPGTGRQVRRRGIRTDRTDSPATVERQEGGQEAPMTFKGVLRPALPTVCPSHDSTTMLSYQELPTSIELWRGHGREAKRGEAGGQRIPGHDEAMGSFLLPCAPPGCPCSRCGV